MGAKNAMHTVQYIYFNHRPHPPDAPTRSRLFVHTQRRRSCSQSREPQPGQTPPQRIVARAPCHQTPGFHCSCRVWTSKPLAGTWKAPFLPHCAGTHSVRSFDWTVEPVAGCVAHATSAFIRMAGEKLTAWLCGVVLPHAAHGFLHRGSSLGWAARSPGVAVPRTRQQSHTPPTHPPAPFLLTQDGTVLVPMHMLLAGAPHRPGPRASTSQAQHPRTATVTQEC